MVNLPARHDLSELKKKVELYFSVQRFDAAEKLLRATLADFGPLANVHNYLGVTYHRQSRFQDAVREFRRALAINPEFIEAALNLTITLADISLYDDAQATFKQAASQASSKQRQPPLVLGRLANRHVATGEAYEECGMLNDAIQEYRKALGLYDRMPDVKLALGRLYLRLGQPERAKHEFEALVKLSPGQAEAHNWLGILNYQLGRQDQAERHWERAQESSPNDLVARAYLKIARAFAPRPEWTEPVPRDRADD